MDGENGKTDTKNGYIFFNFRENAEKVAINRKEK